MRFVVYADALNGDDETLRLIDRLVDRVADEVHRMEVADADLLLTSAWCVNARRTRRDIMMTAAATPPRKRSYQEGLHARILELRNAEDARAADRLAHAPLLILVEDCEADGVLLHILVEELGSCELRELWKRGQGTTPRALEIVNSGGLSAMPQRVDRAVSDAEEEGRLIRLFVLCDSDARWPGDESHSSQGAITKLREICSSLTIPLHILMKRTAENYIPDSVFEAVRDDPGNTDRIDCFNALLRRTREQRDHFPVKDGLSDNERHAALAAGLYDHAETPDLLLLKKQLLPKKPRPLQLLNAERRSAFTAADLRERDGKGELDALLNAIAGEL